MAQQRSLPTTEREPCVRPWEMLRVVGSSRGLIQGLPSRNALSLRPDCGPHQRMFHVKPLRTWVAMPPLRRAGANDRAG